MDQLFRTDIQTPPPGTTHEALSISTEALHKNRLLTVVKLLSYHTPKSLMDVGCGYGALRDLTPFIPHYEGVDHDPALITLAKTKHPDTFTVEKFEELSSRPARSFDAVVCTGLSPYLVGSGDTLDYFINQLCRLASDVVVVDFIDPEKYSGFFTPWDKKAVSDVVRRRFNASTLLAIPDDCYYTVRIPLK